MKMTYVDALTIAVELINQCECSILDVETEGPKYDMVKEKLTAMKEQLMKRGATSDKVKEARKAKTAAARNEIVKIVAPILREGLSHTLQGVTAKELFSLVQDKLPEGFSVAKVQNILLREMAPELEKIEDKRKANTYRLIRD